MFDSSKGSNQQSQHRLTSTNKSVNKSPYKSPSRSHSKALQKSPYKSQSRSHHSANQPFQIPEWVHCEKCFESYDVNANMSLQTCGHIFCSSCLEEGECELPDQKIHCFVCKIPAGHRALNDLLDPKLREMFCPNWTDPLLQINVKTLLFMMTKSQNYVKYLVTQVSETRTIPVVLKEKHVNVKAIVERNRKVRKYANDVSAQIDLIKKAMIVKSDEIRLIRNYEHQLERTPDIQMPNLNNKMAKQDFNFISSGRNEQSNPYINQVKVPHNESIRNMGNTSHSAIRSPYEQRRPEPISNTKMNVVPETRAQLIQAKRLPLIQSTIQASRSQSMQVRSPYSTKAKSPHSMQVKSSHSMQPKSPHSMQCKSPHSMQPKSPHSMQPKSPHSMQPKSSHSMQPRSPHSMQPRSPHSMQATTFRPTNRLRSALPSVKYQLEPPTPGRKRLAPTSAQMPLPSSTPGRKRLASSYQCDEYPIAFKRANNQILRESMLSPPNSSFSFINSINSNRYEKSTPVKPPSYVKFRESTLSDSNSFGPRNQQFR